MCLLLLKLQLGVVISGGTSPDLRDGNGGVSRLALETHPHISARTVKSQ
jgi:hypothetical protein